jgi:hypothetical protein
MNEKHASYSFGVVVFGYSITAKKWKFTVTGNEKEHTIISPAPGGNTTAMKIARVINGAVNRAGMIDNLCRANISQIVNRAKS